MKDDNVKQTFVPCMTVDKIVESLSEAYSALIIKRLPLTAMPSVMLWGAPGVGKSQSVRQIAREIELRTGKRTSVTDVRLLLFNPIDLRGIPTANADKTLAIWLKPQIFDMDADSSVVNILFLDEISAAPPSVQAAAYQITLDRVIGEHKLPDNCIVIAAGNRVTDKSVAYKMPAALANRLLHIDVEGSTESWIKWAVKNGINEKVLGFISFKQDYLFRFADTDAALAFPTPRSWEKVSDILNNINADVNAVYPFVAGLVGTAAALEFKAWCRIYSELPAIEDIFRGKCTKIPSRTDALYALISSMTVYAGEHKNDIDKIENSIEYALRLPPDFSVVLFRDYLYIEKDYMRKLMKIPAFSRWLSTKGKLLNGVI